MNRNAAVDGQLSYHCLSLDDEESRTHWVVQCLKSYLRVPHITPALKTLPFRLEDLESWLPVSQQQVPADSCP